MRAYDLFSHVYDASLERLYQGPREGLAAAMQPGLGLRIVDLACGTGQNFGHLARKVGGDAVRIVGIDASAGMLRRAQQRVARHGWPHVHLLEADARCVGRADLSRVAGPDFEPDYVTCSLGLTALPSWDSVFARFFELLRPGGQFLILDVFAERRVPQTRWVELIARADLSRRVWDPLRAASERFEHRFLPGSPHVHGGRIFLATGFKPAPEAAK